MVQRTALLLFAGCIVGCGNGDKKEAPPKPLLGKVPVAKARDAGAAAVSEDAAPSMRIEPFADNGDEKAALKKLGAVPVWDAVINRGRYLARRKRAGSVWGRVGPAVGNYHWLIDETDGAGSLSIRVAFPETMQVKQGERLLVLGSWKVDEDRHWYWQPSRVARLRAKPDAKPFESVPGHVIVDVDKPPAGAVPVSDVSRSKGGLVTFKVLSMPVRAGDGYRIADPDGWHTVGILILPGDREPYGAQDWRSPEERWQLKRRGKYVVRVGPAYRKKKVKRWFIPGLSAPVRLGGSKTKRP